MTEERFTLEISCNLKVNNWMNDSTKEPRFVNHLLLRKDSVEFRSYQNNISQSAFGKNTLVILPTALGKTVISLFVCANTLYNYRDKRVLVMAPTRPLVTQHMNSFFSVLKIFEDQIAEVTGKDNSSWKKSNLEKTGDKACFCDPRSCQKRHTRKSTFLN